MKKVLLALVTMLMAMASLTMANTEPAEAQRSEQQCFIEERGTVCIRVGAKSICTYVNNVLQGCEQVGTPPHSNGGGQQDVPCDFTVGGCGIFEASASTPYRMAAPSFDASVGRIHGHGWHGPGQGWVHCEFTVEGCGMWGGGLVLAELFDR